LVAFAEVMGRPKKVSIGTVNKDPPPPTVFKNAATKPVRMINGISKYSTEEGLRDEYSIIEYISCNVLIGKVKEIFPHELIQD
jgi:hypothetical protein